MEQLELLIKEILARIEALGKIAWEQHKQIGLLDLRLTRLEQAKRDGE